MASRLSNWLLASALALAGFAIFLGMDLFHNGGLSELEQRGHLTPDRRPASETLSASAASSVAGDAVRQSNLASTTHSQNQSLGVTQRALEREGAQSESVVKVEPSDPRAVIGRPFPVSPSIKARCSAYYTCAATRRLLKEFSQQPRDPVWAPKMEAGIRELVMSQPGYSIRAIECRATLCVAEVASIMGMFNFISPTGPYGSDPSLRSLMALYWETAYERDPSYAAITVTFMTFERRR